MGREIFYDYLACDYVYYILTKSREPYEDLASGTRSLDSRLDCDGWTGTTTPVASKIRTKS